MMIVSIGIAEVREWFNTTNNLTDSQIALLSEMILDKYPDYSINEIKGILREQMQSAQIYNRIDGNIIMRWFAEYETKRIDSIYLARSNADWEEWENDSQDAISFTEYTELLSAKVADGDERAKEIAKSIEKIRQIKTIDVREKEEEKFRKFKTEYLRKKLLNNGK